MQCVPQKELPKLTALPEAVPGNCSPGKPQLKSRDTGPAKESEAADRLRSSSGTKPSAPFQNTGYNRHPSWASLSFQDARSVLLFEYFCGSRKRLQLSEPARQGSQTQLSAQCKAIRARSGKTAGEFQKVRRSLFQEVQY